MVLDLLPNEETREDEEDVDTDETAGEPGEAAVEAEDHGHGQAPETVHIPPEAHRRFASPLPDSIFIWRER